MSNITENRLNTVLAAADIAAINTAITAITTKLPAGSLDDDQRHVQIGQVRRQVIAGRGRRQRYRRRLGQAWSGGGHRASSNVFRR